MSAHSLDVNRVIDAIPGRSVPRSVFGLSIVGVVLGFAAFLISVSANPSWTWGAFLVALVYTLAIAQGGVLFSVMMTLTWGRWGRGLKRIAEAFGAFLPVGYLLLLVFLLAGNRLYPWNPETFVSTGPVPLEPHSEWAISTKSFWLNTPFFIARQLLGFALLIGLDWLYLRASFGPDLIKAGQRLAESNPSWVAPKWWGLLGYGSSNLEEAIAAGQKRQSTLAALIGMSYAIVFSLVAFDMIMSLSPWWFSNMFGAWFFVSSFWLALSALGIIALLSRDWLDLADHITPKVTHDLGKLCLALCMFWAYTFFAQLLPIWYAQMPEETQYLLVRMHPDMEWAPLAQMVGILCFLTPFTILTSRGIKKMKWPFIGVLSLIMLGLFLERTLLVMPSVYFERDFPEFLFFVVSFGVLAGFLGLFTLLFTSVIAKVPALVITDPHLEQHPWDVHVHALGESH